MRAAKVSVLLVENPRHVSQSKLRCCIRETGAKLGELVGRGRQGAKRPLADVLKQKSQDSVLAAKRMQDAVKDEP